MQNIQLINLIDDLDGMAFEANKKINFNLMQINNSVELLPENINDPNIKDMSQLKYLKTVNEIIYANSKIIGFEYPLLRKTLASLFFTDQKIYQPIAKYFLTLKT